MAAHCGGILFPMDVAGHRAVVRHEEGRPAMPRPRRSFDAATSYHVTMRCNNRTPSASTADYVLYAAIAS